MKMFLKTFHGMISPQSMKGWEDISEKGHLEMLKSLGLLYWPLVLVLVSCS